MYVDESGDPGINNSPTKYFILSGMVIHELRWKKVLENLVQFRKYLRDHKGLKLREEIHAGDFVNARSKVKIKRNDRMDILKKCIDWVASSDDISIITVRADKRNYSDSVFELAWGRLIQRFENTIRYRNFPGPANPDERGLILVDNTDGEKLTKLTRKMRKYNPISNRPEYEEGYRNIPIKYIIEDPILRNSNHSFFIQIIDVVVYFAMQYYNPNKYVKLKGGHNFYSRLNPVINPHVTSSGHPLSIVEM